MPIRTIATDMLGIEHPIICGGMTATGSAELAAAVSNAGGLGMLTALHAQTPDRLNELIKHCRSLTDKPFGVNLTILGEKRGEPEFPHEFAEVIAANNIKIMETCGGGIPLMKELHKILRAGGVEVIMSKCVAVKHALTAQTELGSDMVSLMGFDSGGLPGEADTGIFINMALAQKQLTIPFIASGGIATGRQLLAALASVSSMPAKYFLQRVCALGCRWCATRHSIQRHQGVQHFPRLVQAAHDRGRPKGHCYCDEARSCIE
jgi:nitronate monooxygenase